MDIPVRTDPAPRSRRPAVAGYFYPEPPAELAAAVDALFDDAAAEQIDGRALIVPHGGLTHSGRVAAAAIGAVRVPRRCVILGPSHTGSWMPWSLMVNGSYRTPLGDVPVDEPAAQALRERCPFLETDAWAQPGEHSIEAVLPLLQRRGPADLSIVPIILGTADDGQLSRLSEALVQVVRLQEEPVLLIASTDLSHYETTQRGAEQDAAILGAIRTLDGAAVLQCVREQTAVMCGDAVTACVLDAARALGAARARLVRYSTSARTGGDPGSTTGFAGLVIT